MTTFTKISLGIILTLITAIVYLEAWNIGHDVGFSSGYNTAILEGKVLVECKFKPKCE